jgi:hypothetical protein
MSVSKEGTNKDEEASAKKLRDMVTRIHAGDKKAKEIVSALTALCGLLRSDAERGVNLLVEVLSFLDREQLYGKQLVHQFKAVTGKDRARQRTAQAFLVWCTSSIAALVRSEDAVEFLEELLGKKPHHDLIKPFCTEDGFIITIDDSNVEAFTDAVRERMIKLPSYMADANDTKRRAVAISMVIYGERTLAEIIALSLLKSRKFEGDAAKEAVKNVNMAETFLWILQGADSLEVARWYDSWKEKT